MTRKHYRLLAAAMNSALTDAMLSGQPSRLGKVSPSDELVQGRLSGWALAMSELADTLRADNPRFDRDRFYHAAGWADYMRAVR